MKINSMTDENEVIDVVAEEVSEEQPSQEQTIQQINPYDQYVDYKKQTYKFKKLKEQVRNNIKSQRGFGYSYKEIDFS